MELINNILTTISSYISSLNPTQVNWGSFSSIFFYIAQIILTLFIIGSILLAIQNIKKLPEFLKGVLDELKNINWLSRKEGYQYFVLVLSLIIIFTFVIFIFDRALLSVRNLIIFPQV